MVYPPANQHLPTQGIFESMIFLFPFGGICFLVPAGGYDIFGDWRNSLLPTFLGIFQIIATSHEITPNGGLVREIPLFQENLGW